MRKIISSWLAKRLLILFLFLAFIFLGWSVYKFKKISQKVNKTAPRLSQQSFSGRNPDEIAKKVGALIMLPTEERPSIAIINNVAQLQENQPFYKDARNGDLLLLYFQAKKAYIYSESRNIIVNVGPLFWEKETKENIPSTSTVPAS